MLNLSGADTLLFQKNYVNILVVDALGPSADKLCSIKVFFILAYASFLP